MYKPETIKKLIRLYNEKKADFEKMDIHQLAKIFSISTGNTKIGHTLNVSLMPIITCHNCGECKNYCYDIKACVFHTNTTLIARIKNTVLLKRDRDLYFDLIDGKCSRRRTNKYFRRHVAGDILDADYFERMINIARKHDDFIFWTYTKNYSIVNQYVAEHGNNRKTSIPSNFHIMFSEWDGTPLDNPFSFPTFTVKMTAGNKNHDSEFFDSLYQCPGNCDICKNGNMGCIGGMDTFVNEH